MPACYLPIEVTFSLLRPEYHDFFRMGISMIAGQKGLTSDARCHTAANPSEDNHTAGDGTQ